MPVLFVTGAGGFVGTALARALGREPTSLRMSTGDWEAEARHKLVAEATVIHLAGRVHGEGLGPESDYMRDNMEKTRRLAALACDRGVRRFVYLSTIKVHGEESARPWREDDATFPEDAYARSKLAAERALSEFAARGLEVCVLRCPLVLGARARGNLATFLRLADSPWPLPFGRLQAPRSFIHVDDLAEALLRCATSRDAPGRCYHVAARETFSTARLVAGIRKRLGRPTRLVTMPPSWVEWACRALGQDGRRLTRPLMSDPSRLECETGWRAQRGLEAALDDLVAGYRA